MWALLIARYLQIKKKAWAQQAASLRFIFDSAILLHYPARALHLGTPTTVA